MNFSVDTLVGHADADRNVSDHDLGDGQRRRLRGQPGLRHHGDCNGVTIVVAPPTLGSANGGRRRIRPVTFTATGGTGPYTFTEVGGLPTGMTFSVDTLSGTPMQGGTFPITVTATDAGGCTGATAYGLVVVCPTIAVTTPTTDDGYRRRGVQPELLADRRRGHGDLYNDLDPSDRHVALDRGRPFRPAGPARHLPDRREGDRCERLHGHERDVHARHLLPGHHRHESRNGNRNGGRGLQPDLLAVGCRHAHAARRSRRHRTLDGLTLSAAGVLSGTPTAPGTFPIVVTVTDANGCTGTSATYTLVVACQTITVTNPSAAPATYNTALGPAASYTFTQTGVGTHTPATFTVASGTLPTGVSLTTSGVLTGTPTQTGTFTITVKATDANGCSGAGASYVLTVAPTAPAQGYTGVGNTQL